MVRTYTPTYYTSLHDSITSICKTILPFSFKKRRIPAIAAAEQRLSKQQSDNLKWQQESFHQILNLMELCKEGIIEDNELSTFRNHLLETTIASPLDHEASVILRDKLIFLQELLYAKCISEDEYHSSKRPLLQRLAVQGAVIGARDVIVGPHKDISDQEWSVINLKEDQFLPKTKPNAPSQIKKLKEDKAVAVRDQNVSTGKFPRNELVCCSTENPFWNHHVKEEESESKPILMVSEKQQSGGSQNGKRKPFRALFHRDEKGGDGLDHSALEHKEKVKIVNKTWGFDGLLKRKKNDSEDETSPLSLCQKSDEANYPDRTIVEVQEKTMTKMDSDGDEALVGNMKEKLSQIQRELGARLNLPDDRKDDISTQHPKSDPHAEVVVSMVRKEIKDCLSQIGNTQVEKHRSNRWTTFDDDEENSHPNLFMNARASSSFKYNPFFDM